MKAIQAEEQLLIFKVGHVMCCVAAREVDSVINAQPVNHVPHQAESIAGVIQYRDETVSVINVFKKFELLTPEDPEHGRFIMAYTRHGIVGYWVDEVIDITSDFGAHWSAPPIFVDGNVFDKTLIWNEELVLSTDFNKLFAMHDSTPLQAWANEQGLMEDISVETSEPESLQELSSVTEIVDEPVDVAIASDEQSSNTEEAPAVVEEVVSVDSLTALERIDNTTNLSGVSESESFADTSEKQSTIFHIADSISISVIDDIKDDNKQVKKVVDTVEANRPTQQSSAVKSDSRLEAKKKLKKQKKKTPDAKNKASESYQEKVVPFEFSQNKTTQTVYEAIKLYLEPTSKQLKWANDPYVTHRSESVEAPTAQDVEKFFEEKLADKINEYFSSVDASKSANENFEKDSEVSLDSEVDNSKEVPDTPSSIVTTDERSKEDVEKDAHYVSDFDIDTNVVVGDFSTPALEESELSTFKIDDEAGDVKKGRHEKDHPFEKEFKIDTDIVTGDSSIPAFGSSEISDIEVNDVAPIRPSHDKALRARREASVLKVIDRIEKNKPGTSQTTKLRGFASILFVASLVFLLAHFDLLPEFAREDVDELQLISEIKPAPENANISLPVLDRSASDRIPTMKTAAESSALGAIAFKESNMPAPLSRPTLNWQKHVVIGGDTLWDIAGAKLNNPFRYPDLARWSQIKNPDLIYPGDEVKYTRDQEK